LKGQPLLLWMVENCQLEAGNRRRVRSEHFAFGNPPASRFAVVNPNRNAARPLRWRKGLHHVPPDAKWLSSPRWTNPAVGALSSSAGGAQTHTGKMWPNGRAARHPVLLAGHCAITARPGRSSQGLRGLLDAHREETYRLPDCNPAWLRWI